MSSPSQLPVFGLQLDVLSFQAPLAQSDWTWALSQVSEERRRQINRFLHWQDAHRALFAELLLNTVAVHRLRVPREALVFGRGKWGKPCLLSHPHLHFNLTHSGSHILCASADTPLGIDAESPGPIDEAVWDLALSPDEYRVMHNCPIEDRSQRFITLWTVKESFAKALGMGLELSFTDLTIQDRPEGITLLRRDEPIPDWTFHRGRLASSLTWCLCCRSPHPPTVRNWTPQDLVSSLKSPTPIWSRP
jgi:4'-phosphopantetheinyl transferase